MVDAIENAASPLLAVTNVTVPVAVTDEERRPAPVIEIVAVSAAVF